MPNLARGLWLADLVTCISAPVTALNDYVVAACSGKAGNPQVVDTIAAGLLERVDDGKPISEVLYGILQSKYPCPESS